MPRPAATIALIRNGPEGLETWMMRRVVGMAFASGAVVFPGGRVDDADADEAIAWHGNTPEALANRLGIEVSRARALVTAALRELFEEAGVLLTTPRPLGDVEPERRALETRNLRLSDWLAEKAYALDVSGIQPWARWVTPPTEPRRFDTWFFVVSMPSGVDARSASTEASSAGWIGVREALDLAERRELLVLPPTMVMLRGLLAAETVDGVLAAASARSLEPVHPDVRHNEDGTILVRGGGEEVLVRP